MDQSSSEDYVDENSKLESKVVLALSRLQKGKKCSSQRGKTYGVGKKQVVDYLNSHYCYLDGDIESQVITALLSCIKSGIICALDNGRYRLVGPSSRTMVSNCLTHPLHGIKCCCLGTLKRMSKKLPSPCCTLRVEVDVSKPGKKFTKTLKQRTLTKSSVAQRRSSKKVERKRTTRRNCVQKAESQKSEQSVIVDPPKDKRYPKCDYCLQSHPPPSPADEKKVCNDCYPPGTRYGVPFDKFSPREEVM